MQCAEMKKMDGLLSQKVRSQRTTNDTISLPTPEGHQRSIIIEDWAL